MYFLVSRALSIDDVGVSRDTVFEEIRPGAGFETGDFDKERLRGLPQNDAPAFSLNLPVRSLKQKKRQLRPKNLSCHGTQTKHICVW